MAAITHRPMYIFLAPLNEEAAGDIKVMVNGCEITRKIYPWWPIEIIELSGTEIDFLFEDCIRYHKINRVTASTDTEANRLKITAYVVLLNRMVSIGQKSQDDLQKVSWH